MPELGVGGAVHHHGPGDTTLRDQMAVVWRRKWLVVVPTLVAVALALIVSATQPERYRASTDVLIKRPPSATNVVAPDSALTAREVQNELLRARGSTIQDAARTVLGAEPDLSVGLASSDNADVLVFTAESRDPERAAVAADTYAEVYIEARRAALTSDYEARVKVVQERLVEVDRRLAEYPDGAVDEEFVDLVTQKSQMQLELEGLITSISLANESGAQVIDAAQVPDAPFRPTPLRTATLALVVGLLIGLGLAFLVDRLEDKIRDEADLARSTGLPVLAVVPKLKEADTYFSGPTKAYTNTNATQIAGTTNDAIYVSERSTTANLQTFSYDIPLPQAGSYLVRLHFAEIWFVGAGGGPAQPGNRVFSVNLEGGPVETQNLDLVAAVGPATAYTQEFVVTVTDGNLDIDFSASVNQAKVSAIEVLAAGSGPALRYNAGGGELTVNGVTWAADPAQGAPGYRSYTNPALTQVAGTDDDLLYFSTRSDNASSWGYDLAVPNGTYTVRLHFVEVYFGVGSAAGNANSRRFSIALEGATVRSGYSIYEDVGPGTLDIEQYTVTVTDGNLDIDFTATANQPSINAFEIIPA